VFSKYFSILIVCDVFSHYTQISLSTQPVCRSSAEGRAVRSSLLLPVRPMADYSVTVFHPQYLIYPIYEIFLTAKNMNRKIFWKGKCHQSYLDSFEEDVMKESAKKAVEIISNN